MKRNKFNLSHYKLGSADMGKIYPISCYEVLPGDTIRQGTNVFLRFAPMLASVMHPVKVSTYTFFCPTRLVYDKWEDFITGGPDGLDVSHLPTITISNGVSEKSLADYLGVPTGYTGPYSALPCRAYYRIYNEYFRDQDLCSEMSMGLATHDNDLTSATDSQLNIQNASWEKDYFTTARPWMQKGAQVNVPVNGVSGSQTVTISSNGKPTFQPINQDNILSGINGLFNVQHRSPANSNLTGPLSGQFQKDEQGNITNKDLTWGDPALKATLTNSSQGVGNVSLNDLREAMALQRFEEARAMYGSRYTEYLRYLGVKSSDARLQRPEYLGGSTNVIQFSEVLQTAADGQTPVGTIRGHGIGATRSKRFRRFFEEHGFVMTLMVIRPIAVYMQGLNKMWSRATKEDYWQKELQHIGQQEVLNKELYALGANPDDVFGYQNRYDDYRSVPSTVSGELRSTLNYWHLARDFANQPVLNSSFVAGAPTKRVFAEQTMNEIYFMAQNSVVVRRLMSKNGNPLM